MYLLRMHADRDAFELVQCADLRHQALSVLALEGTRLCGVPAAEFVPGLPAAAVEAAWREAADSWEATRTSAAAGRPPPSNAIELHHGSPPAPAA